MTTTARTYPEVSFDTTTKVTLTPEVTALLRADAIQTLDALRRELDDLFSDGVRYDGSEARFDLEHIADRFRKASDQCDVLWWLAPSE